MKRSEYSEKKRLFFDGVEIPGLIKSNEIKRTKSTVNSPSYKKVRKVSSGIMTIPDIELTYKVEAGTVTSKYFNDFFENDETHDVTEVRENQYGDEIGRRIWQLCECIDHRTPPYDAENPELASVTVILAPWDIKTLL